MLLDVVKVRPSDGHWLFLEFKNGEQRRFDMTPYFDQKPWLRIKSSPLFERVFIEKALQRYSGLCRIIAVQQCDRSLIDLVLVIDRLLVAAI